MKPLGLTWAALILLLGLAPAAPRAQSAVADIIDKTSLHVPQYSRAGFFDLEGSGRQVFNFNVGWRFAKADAEGAEATDFDDSDWAVVNAPHGLELLPDKASGGVNYQGPAWYRKHFTPPASLASRQLTLYFEAVMGKSRVYVNGRQVAEHFGGYLPIVIDVTDALHPGAENVVAVWTDNSDDPAFPPGKPQAELDFTYFGGIYRDTYLISVAPVHVTDANYANEEAGGGVFVRFENFSANSVDVVVRTEVANDSDSARSVSVENTVRARDGSGASPSARQTLNLAGGARQTVEQRITVANPHYWGPDDPFLYFVDSRVRDGQRAVDGVRTRVGIRKIEFRGADGLTLNDEPFPTKLIGGNRHQDYAYVGNALPNSGQWRDAKLLRDAGMRIVRAAHYPMDPAFMDAADELGLFVIVPTPGWQFWNNDPIFAERVYSDIRNMIRRDRNHASVIMWEPVLNETGYPPEFAAETYRITHAEYPYDGCYATADPGRATGGYDVLYGRGGFGRGGRGGAGAQPPARVVSNFVREWGDNVDDWSSHNSNSRVYKGWGEAAMLIQAWHYTVDPTGTTDLNQLYSAPRQLFGGCLWHPFDQQRGYHPDPFYGGLLDVFRQPKYSYYGFMAQRDPNLSVPWVDSGPFVYIAAEMTPFSPSDAVVFTNCDEVRLTALGQDLGTQSTVDNDLSIPHAPLLFKDAWDFMRSKRVHGRGAQRNPDESIVAEGLIDGQVVARAVRVPALRPSRIMLAADFSGHHLVADGSDFVPAIAYITDDGGNVKRLNEDEVLFSVSGQGRLIGDVANGANPRRVVWGEAPALVRSTQTAGDITIHAQVWKPGINLPVEGELTITSVPSSGDFLFDEQPDYNVAEASGLRLGVPGTEMSREELRQRLQQVGAQQDMYAPQ